MISKEILERERTPSELSRFILSTFEQIKSDPVKKSAFRLKKDLYKYFIHELYPLSLFAINRYDDNKLCKPIIGNQNYDAEIIEADKIVDKVEISWAINGRKAYEEAKELNATGATEVVTLDMHHEQSKVYNRCIANLEKKALNDYSDCILLIVFDGYPGFSLFKREDKRLINMLLEEAKKLNFKAKKVYLLVQPEEAINNNGKISVPEILYPIQ